MAALATMFSTPPKPAPATTPTLLTTTPRAPTSCSMRRVTLWAPLTEVAAAPITRIGSPMISPESFIPVAAPKATPARAKPSIRRFPLFRSA